MIINRSSLKYKLHQFVYIDANEDQLYLSVLTDKKANLKDSMWAISGRLYSLEAKVNGLEDVYAML